MVKCLVLDGKLDVAAVGNLNAELLASSGADVVLDFSNVTLLGALCLQSCLAAARAAKDAQTSFSIINVIDPVLEQLGAMGFTPETLAEGGI